MLLNLLEYHWAEDIDDALFLLSRTDIKTVPLAGGTYVLGQTDETIQAVVDLRDLQLAYIKEDAQTIHIGAMTTLQNMADSPLLKNTVDSLLSRAAQASSFSRLLRNSATLGGTIGAGAASQADILTALAVMDAEVVLRSGSQTSVSLGGASSSGIVYKGKHERRIAFHSLALERRPNELIIEVRIPRPVATAGGAFERVGRTPTDVALLNAAALVEIRDEVYQRVRLALGGVNMEPVRLYAIEQQLEGKPADIGAEFITLVVQAAIADTRLPSDFRASSDYRHICGVSLVNHVLEEATNGSRWRGKFSGKGA
jgi:CO/xanthine dehydrogenase FAD-binding subunit